MNAKEFFPATIRGAEDLALELGPDQMKSLMCSFDLEKDFVWAEVNGVRKIQEIRYSSQSFNEEIGFSIVLVRTFTYQTSDPFDLVNQKNEVEAT